MFTFPFPTAVRERKETPPTAGEDLERNVRWLYRNSGESKNQIRSKGIAKEYAVLLGLNRDIDARSVGSERQSARSNAVLDLITQSPSFPK
jgi:hypothetical protein